MGCQNHVHSERLSTAPSTTVHDGNDVGLIPSATSRDGSEKTADAVANTVADALDMPPDVPADPASILARMDDITQWLVSVDPALDHVIRESTIEWDVFVKTPFVALVGAVVGTTVRYTQARAVRQALYERLGGVDFGHDALARLLDDDGARRAVGLTAKHTAILRALCERAAESGSLETAEDVRRLATNVPGIGAWTKETAIITCLLDADAFPSVDKWLRRKMAAVYGMAKSPTPKQAEIMARRWSPYRAIVVAYLWRWFDQTETAQICHHDTSGNNGDNNK
ncbi:DNA-3-methyladenine glycosylase [Pandoravirus macleodensis]|uniref:DNA-3-methyladenine glycosylase n=1 Tax=Pandoravirus macleodensis TaxID=2107707 RepID=A0A2U7UE67_9VIRU|nr:DNA-3-methyladenine glycosylase [Pandoravirus macleodensis]AVK76761.1 DNA-3-methyladenine glycosylase [Pandoravirus macleodensis]